MLSFCFHDMEVYINARLFCNSTEVTKLLTYFAQACHDLVPPEVCCHEHLNLELGTFTRK